MAGSGMGKRAILASFSSHRNGSLRSGSKLDKVKGKQRAASSMIEFKSRETANDSAVKSHSSPANDTVDELASMLLDDTGHSRLNESNRHFSDHQVHNEHSDTTSRTSGKPLSAEKPLPEVPDLSFTAGDETFCYNGAPVMTGALAANATDVAGSTDDLDSYPPPILREPSHARRGSGPPLPRKSSKRRSAQPKQPASIENHGNDAEKELVGHANFTSPARQEIVNPSTPIRRVSRVPANDEIPDIDKKIANMLAASEKLKPGSSSSSAPSPNNSWSIFSSSKMLAKVKNVFNSFLTDNSKKTAESISMRNLKAPDYEGDPMYANSSELRLNEGENLNNKAKIEKITGHGAIKRKPLADDGHSLRSRASAESIAYRANMDHYPWHFSHPGRHSPLRSKTDLSNIGSNDESMTLKDLQQTLRDGLPRISKDGRPTAEIDFEALFNSSPLGQSTPRLRLEPSFELNGKKKLVNVSMSSPSMFDPVRTRAVDDGDADDERELAGVSLRKAPSKYILNAVKRSNSQIKDAGLSVKRHVSQKLSRKKHPSPSKEYLEELSDAWDLYQRTHTTERVVEENDSSKSSTEVENDKVLAPKDSNALNLEAPKNSVKGKEVDVFNTSNEPTSVVLAETSQLVARPTSLPRPSRIPRPIGKRYDINSRSAKRFMAGENRLDSRLEDGPSDGDELAWNDTAHHIGMKRVKVY